MAYAGWSYRVPMLTGSVESLYEFENSSGKIGSEELSKLYDELADRVNK